MYGRENPPEKYGAVTRVLQCSPQMLGGGGKGANQKKKKKKRTTGALVFASKKKHEHPVLGDGSQEKVESNGRESV